MQGNNLIHAAGQVSGLYLCPRTLEESTMNRACLAEKSMGWGLKGESIKYTTLEEVCSEVKVRT